MAQVKTSTKPKVPCPKRMGTAATTPDRRAEIVKQLQLRPDAMTIALRLADRQGPAALRGSRRMKEDFAWQAPTLAEEAAVVDSALSKGHAPRLRRQIEVDSAVAKAVQTAYGESASPVARSTLAVRRTRSAELRARAAAQIEASPVFLERKKIGLQPAFKSRFSATALE